VLSKKPDNDNHQPQGFVLQGPQMTDSRTSSKNDVNVELFFIPLSDISSPQTSLAQSWLSDVRRKHHSLSLG